MPTQWVKQEAKRNEVAVFLNKLLNYFLENRERTYTFLTVLGALIVLGIFFLFYFIRINEQCLEQLSMAQSYVFRNTPQQALPITEKILKNFSYSRYIPDAIYLQGEIFYQLQKYPEAEQSYQKFLKKYGSKPMSPLSLAGLGHAQEEQGKYQEALASYQKFLDKHGENFLAGDMFQSEARVYELLNQPQKAKEVYEKIVLLFQDPYWKSFAEKRLAMIQKDKIPLLKEMTNKTIPIVPMK